MPKASLQAREPLLERAQTPRDVGDRAGAKSGEVRLPAQGGILNFAQNRVMPVHTGGDGVGVSRRFRLRTPVVERQLPGKDGNLEFLHHSEVKIPISEHVVRLIEITDALVNLPAIKERDGREEIPAHHAEEANIL